MRKYSRMWYIDQIRREAARDWEKLISTDHGNRTSATLEASLAAAEDSAPPPLEEPASRA